MQNNSCDNNLQHNSSNGIRNNNHKTSFATTIAKHHLQQQLQNISFNNDRKISISTASAKNSGNNNDKQKMQTQEVLTDVNAEEVLTDEKPNSS